MKVFFYGLFMDERLLADKGIVPSESALGYIDGFRLRIGERATLRRDSGSRAYGVVMNITADEARTLYAEPSVADYRPETAIAELMDGTRIEAICYKLPPDKVAGTNSKYAESLLTFARSLDFPDSYLDQIRQACP